MISLSYLYIFWDNHSLTTAIPGIIRWLFLPIFPWRFRAQLQLFGLGLHGHAGAPMAMVAVGRNSQKKPSPPKKGRKYMVDMVDMVL